jgi:gliding motility-associated-like protein
MDSVQHSYNFHPPSGSFPATVILYNSDSTCSSFHTVNIDLKPVIAGFTRKIDDTDTTICLGELFPFTNTSDGADIVNWDFGDGQIAQATNTVNNNYTAVGTYEVIVDIENITSGCTDTITKKVIVASVPEVATVNDTICEGNTVNLIVTNPNSIFQYEWIPAAFVVQPDTAITSSVPLALTTVFTVTVTDTLSPARCNSSANSTIIVINPVELNNLDTIVVMGDTVYFPLNINANLYNFTWTPEEGLSCLSCNNPYINPIDKQSFHLELTDIKGCFTTSATYDVDVYPETFVKLPTTFTPNGDGVNDVIYLQGWGIKELIEYKIFNRWGEVVFETDELTVGWNGYYKGILQNNDVYVFKVMVTNWKNEELTLEGHINLMR